MNAHTPGPWEVDHRINIIEPGKGACVVANVNRHRYANYEANARLIATAPELLAALKEAVLQIEYLHEKFKQTGSGEAVLFRARAAIAKAAP